MKKIVKLYLLPLILTLMFAVPAEAQIASNNYDKAKENTSSEKKREKQRRKREKKAEKDSEQMNTDAQHGWLFSKKRKKKTQGSEGKN